MLDVGVEPAVGVGDQFLGVGAQVAVGVASQPEVGRFADEHAAIEHLQRSRQYQLVEEDRLLVHLPVVIEIFEDADASERLALAGRGDVAHVAEHLDDPQPAVGIRVDEHGLLDHRLARHQLDVVAGRQKECLHLVLGREDGRVGRRGMQARRPGAGRLRRMRRRYRSQPREHAGGPPGFW